MTSGLFELGEKYPGTLPSEGMLLIINPDEDCTRLQIIMVAVLSDFHPRDIESLNKNSNNIGIVPFPPLLFVLFHNQTMQFDAPLNLGAYHPDTVAQLRACAAKAHDRPIYDLQPIEFILVDQKTENIVAIRYMSLTKAWWSALADAIDRCPDGLSKDAYDKAVKRAYKKWPTPIKMVPACSHIEPAGLSVFEITFTSPTEDKRA